MAYQTIPAGAGGTVSTSAPVSGDGSAGSPITISGGTATEFSGDGTANLAVTFPESTGVYRIWGMLFRNDVAIGEITARPNGLTTNQLGVLFEVNNSTSALSFPSATELFIGRAFSAIVFFDVTISLAIGSPRRMSGMSESRATAVTAPTYTWYSQSEWNDSATAITGLTFHISNSNEFTSASRVYVQRIG